MKILVVEDDEFAGKLLGHIFGRQGHEIVQAFDGLEAAKMIDEQDPPDVVVLDYMLPGISGLEVLKKLRAHERWTDVPVIFVSARTALEDIDEVLQAGADDYLTKPFGRPQLEERVMTIVANREQSRRRRELDAAGSARTETEED